MIMVMVTTTIMAMGTRMAMTTITTVMTIITSTGKSEEPRKHGDRRKRQSPSPARSRRYCFNSAS
jgi:hypothetical protein